jgi:hypothetical protein
MNSLGHILACGSYFSIPKNYFYDVLSDETASNFYSLPFLFDYQRKRPNQH